MIVEHLEDELKEAPDFKVEETPNGWLAKHEDVMIKKDNNIIAYFMYFPKREEAVRHYHKFVTEPNTSLLMPNLSFEEWKYNGDGFDKVIKEVKV